MTQDNLMEERSVLPGSKRIILWGREDAFGWSMEFFLNIPECWEVIPVRREDGIEALIQQVETLQPCAIILYGEDDANDRGLLTRLMNTSGRLKVINASLEESTIEVFTKETVTIRGIADLLSSIENRSLTIQPGEEVK